MPSPILPSVRVIAFTITDENGQYEFENVPESDSAYNICVNVDGHKLESTYRGLVVNINDTLFLSLDFEVDSAQMTVSAVKTWQDTTAVRQPESFAVQIYPNPTDGKFYIESDETIDKAEIYKQTSLVKTIAPLEGNMIALGGLPAGVYIIRLYRGNAMTVKKVAIVR
jgi:hypothetical protein